MEVTRTAYGTWNGGRFMHYGEPLSDERFISVIRHAYEKGIRSFMTADVYGNGQADELLGNALSVFPRDSFCLIGAIGHDFYTGKREGSKGYPRFTDPKLRSQDQFADYIEMATSKVVARCKTDYLDLLLLHNPDSIGYSSELVWNAMANLKKSGRAKMLGVAPGPANGFTLDVIACFEKFGSQIDWAMIILNPMEKWPGAMVLPAAEKHGVKLITRVVDYGGLFHDDVKNGHKFGAQDHRGFRPAGWVEAGNTKLEQMRHIAEAHKLTMLQLACIWNLSQPAVGCVLPTLIQEVGEGTKSIEQKVQELADLPDIKLSPQESGEIDMIGNNKGCMTLKGGSPSYSGEVVADQWGMNPELSGVAERWGIKPELDLVCTHKS
ncbi:MAG: aldo/keto reductase [Verrucomicrobiales bacterium]|nr:aldo/keto reductase [Verrucomicrobiales bacterium]